MSLAELRARKADREAALQKEAEALEEERLTLEEKFEVDGARIRVDFDVVTTAVGNFVVKKPDFLTAKRLVDKDRQSVEDVVNFVVPCIAFPDRAGLGNVFQVHAGIAHKLSVAILAMYEASAANRLGK